MSKQFGTAQNAGGIGPFALAGPPTSGVSEVQTLTSTATGGLIAVSLNNFKTAYFASNSTAAQIQAVLRSLLNVGADGVNCAGGALGTAAVSVTFSGALAGLNMPQLVVDNTQATGGVCTAATTTQGVQASFRGCSVGAILTDTTNGVLYINTGSVNVPTWTKVGTQS